jgi:ubiquinone/menaquinone biosynthesis C-methylase UbiE
LTDQTDAMAIVMGGQAHKLSTNSEREALKQKIARGYSTTAQASREAWNWGFHEDAVHSALASKLIGYDRFESDGHCEQLYYYTLSCIPNADTQPRKILEVGCGAGGGLNFLSRVESQSEFVGIDLAQTALEHANARFARPGTLSYKYGDAEKLPFPDGEFDAVINVESAHNYPSFETFIREVARVLKPGGYFSIVDAFTPTHYEEFERVRGLNTTGLHWLNERDISDSVKAAIKKRVTPGSPFRRHLRQLWRVPFCYFVIPVMLRAYGAYFLNPGGAISRRIRFLPFNGFRAIGGITSYRHALATKPLSLTS